MDNIVGLGKDEGSGLSIPFTSDRRIDDRFSRPDMTRPLSSARRHRHSYHCESEANQRWRWRRSLLWQPINLCFDPAEAPLLGPVSGLGRDGLF